MGHIHLGRLPKTRPWNAVVDLLRVGASTADIAEATAKAAENSLAPAASDPALRHAFWLLTQLPLAARSTDFAGRLMELKLDAGSRIVRSDACGSVSSVDRCAFAQCQGQDRSRRMAQLAATEALTTLLAADLPGLFGTTSEDVRYALGKLAAPDRFAKLSREFFARLEIATSNTSSVARSPTTSVRAADSDRSMTKMSFARLWPSTVMRQRSLSRHFPVNGTRKQIGKEA